MLSLRMTVRGGGGSVVVRAAELLNTALLCLHRPVFKTKP